MILKVGNRPGVGSSPKLSVGWIIQGQEELEERDRRPQVVLFIQSTPFIIYKIIKSLLVV